MPPRFALIGVTGYAALHLDHLARLTREGRIILTAAAVVNPTEAAAGLAVLADLGAEVFPTAEALFATKRGQIDLCCIPTGISLHRPLVEAALAAGAHVLVEKPLAGCVTDARAIAAASVAAGRTVLVGFQDVWDPATTTVRTALDEGVIGRVQRVALRASWPRGRGYYARNGWVGRRSDRFGIVNDSPVANACAHFVNLALRFAAAGSGRVVARPLAVQGTVARVNPIETFDSALVEFATDGGVPVRVALTHAGPEQQQPELVVDGERGRLVWRFYGEVTVEGADGVRTLVRSDSDAGRRWMFDAAVELAAGCWDGRGCTAQDAIPQVEAIDLLAALPVREVPAEEIGERTGNDGDVQRICHGIGPRLAAWAGYADGGDIAS